MFVARAFSYQNGLKALPEHDYTEPRSITEKTSTKSQPEGRRSSSWSTVMPVKAPVERQPAIKKTSGDSSPTMARYERSEKHGLNYSNQPTEKFPNLQNETSTKQSTPVAVPHRHPMDKSSKTTLPCRKMSQDECTSSHRRQYRRSNGTPISPSVAALLQTTSIPRKTSFPKPRSTPRRMSTQQLMDEWSRDETYSGSSISSSPNMEVLLSPPQEEDYLKRHDSVDSFDQLSRSTSSESMLSLEADRSSTFSSSFLSTPGAVSQRRTKDKLHHQFQKVDDDLGHPLSPPSNNDTHFLPPTPTMASSTPANDTIPKSSPPQAFQPTPLSRRPSNFKSNLTSSLQSLRNSIRTSLANFNAPIPYVLPEDHLYRGLGNGAYLPIQREMRPRPLSGPVSPELRRYLNPSPYHVSSPALDFHLHSHGRVIENMDLEAVAAATSPGMADEPLPALKDRDSVIPLQTYNRDRSSKIASTAIETRSTAIETVSESLTEAGRALSLTSAGNKPQYRRELRENGEFLRICILELNMRRAGKLADGPGRARIWLPPRVDTEQSLAYRNNRVTLPNSREIPKRWTSLPV